MICHNDVNDVTVAAHTIKSILNIKFTRAKERHAKAMGFNSSNDLLVALKEGSVECEFDVYIEILKKEALANHQIVINDELVKLLRYELLE